MHKTLNPFKSLDSLSSSLLLFFPHPDRKHPQSILLSCSINQNAFLVHSKSVHMGRNLSPIVRRELENLDKDPDSRRSAMKALKTYVKDLDTKAIPLFLAQVSGTKEHGSSAGEYTISLYEVLARVHGRNIVPQIENIMMTIMRTLSLSAGSFPLHQACSKVVPAIARYGIDPTTPEDEKERIISSLCKPLSDVLMGSVDGESSGAALCLKALVECDNWRFASDGVVNEVCLKVAGALEEKQTRTTAHMGLAMALLKHNTLIIEAYARSLLRSGLQILTAGLQESNSQKRLTAVQMINFLMKCVDSRSISSELTTVIDVMEKCQSDCMPFVRGAAFEALQTAKTIAGQKGPRHERSPSPVADLNLNRKNGRISWADNNKVNADHDAFAKEIPSPESQNVDSFVDYDPSVESPMSIGQSSSNYDYATRANRRLWSNDMGLVGLSEKRGLVHNTNSEGDDSKAESEQHINGEISEIQKEQSEASSGWTGFVESSVTSMVNHDTTCSPQRSRPHLAVDDVKIYSTPRKLVRSLQSTSMANSGVSVKHPGALITPISDEVEWNTAMLMNGEDHSQDLNSENGENNMESMGVLNNQELVQDAKPLSDSTESILSTCDDPADCTCKNLSIAGFEDEDDIQIENSRRRTYFKASASLVCCFFVIILAVLFSAVWIDDDEVFYLVPT